ncbi:hypothetical protein SK128_016106 [Halocaridina rubra]|uniref:Uncharacterized protein n=1 Tax=Halocaridina rubra TaxID=373956 RepID=A0AAN9A4F6_HALRR
MKERRTLRFESRDHLFLWFCLILTASVSTAEEPILLWENSNYCQLDNGTQVLNCYLDNQAGRLIAQNWVNKGGITIYSATSLVIEPQCDANTKYLTIHDSTGITSRESDDERFKDCKVILKLENSTAKNLDSLFNKVISRDSYIQTIGMNLQDLQVITSNVSSLKTSGKTLIITSKIKEVTVLDVHDKQKLEIEDSEITYLKKLVYNTSEIKSRITSTNVESVAEEGIEIYQGSLAVENVTFNYLSTNAIVVYGGKLEMKNTLIKTAKLESIILKNGATISFDNVTTAGAMAVSAEIKVLGYEDIWALGAFPTFHPPLTIGIFLGIGIIIGLVSAILLAVALYFSPCIPWHFNKKEKLESKHFPLKSVTTPSSQLNPDPPTPLTGHSTTEKELENLDETYQDVESVNPQGVAHSMPYKYTNDTRSPKVFPPLTGSQPPSPQILEDTYDDPSQIPLPGKQLYDEYINLESQEQHKVIPAQKPFYPQPPPKPTSVFHDPTKNSNQNSPLPQKKYQTQKQEEHSIEHWPPPPSTTKLSFLHSETKPPPPPRSMTKPQYTTESKAKAPGMLPAWAPQLPVDQSHFSGSTEDEDIYEDMP